MRFLRAFAIGVITAVIGMSETWSDWILATQRADLPPVPGPERIAVRFRVRPVDN